MFVYINIKAKQIKQMKKGTSVTSILMFFLLMHHYVLVLIMATDFTTFGLMVGNVGVEFVVS